MLENNDYKIADKFGASLSKRFDSIDANADGKLTREELQQPAPEGNVSAYERHVHEAARLFFLETLDSCGHQERSQRTTRMSTKGTYETVQVLNPDLTQPGELVSVMSKKDLAEFRQQMQTKAQLSAPVDSVVDAEGLLQVVSSSFADIDKDRDGKISEKELTDFSFLTGNKHASGYLKEAALHYVMEKLKEDGQLRQVQTQELVSPAHTERGATTLLPMRAGKITVMVPLKHPDREIPAQYRTVSSNERFLEQSDLQRWRK